MPAPKPSKSARKREFLALQELGEQLLTLKPEQLDDLALDSRLHIAVVEARTMTSRGALRRQKQYIGKLMRDVDPAPIRAALEHLSGSDRRAKAVFHKAESWRDRIAAGGTAVLDEFLDSIEGDNADLRGYVAQLGQAPDDQSRRILRRRIFAEIHKELALKVQEASQ